MKKLKHYRYRLEYIGLLLAAWIVQRLPYAWLRPLGNGVGSLFFLVDGHRRKVALANLKAAFGGKYDPAARLKIARKSYGIFATTILELLWSPNLTPTIIDEIAVVEEMDPHNTHRTEGIPTIYCCLHAGNFEWCGQVTASHTTRFPVIAQKSKNPFLGPLFDRWRSSLGQEVFPQEQAMLKLFRYLKTGGKMGILVDLNLKPREGPVIIRSFGNLLLPITRLPAELALRTGAVLVPMECVLRPEGGYIMRYLPAIPITKESTVESLTQAYWDALEKELHLHPEKWLWTYKHWRYLPSCEKEETYPFYANRFEEFDTLLEKQNKKIL